MTYNSPVKMYPACHRFRSIALGLKFLHGLPRSLTKLRDVKMYSVCTLFTIIALGLSYYLLVCLLS